MQILLSLDPAEDPLAAILMVDFYALRAREYAWMVQLHRVWDKHRWNTSFKSVAVGFHNNCNYWKCNLPTQPHVRLLIGWSAGLSQFP